MSLHKATTTDRNLNPSLVLLFPALMIRSKEWCADALPILWRQDPR